MVVFVGIGRSPLSKACVTEVLTGPLKDDIKIQTDTLLTSEMSRLQTKPTTLSNFFTHVKTSLN